VLFGPVSGHSWSDPREASTFLSFCKFHKFGLCLPRLLSNSFQNKRPCAEGMRVRRVRACILYVGSPTRPPALDLYMSICIGKINKSGTIALTEEKHYNGRLA